MLAKLFRSKEKILHRKLNNNNNNNNLLSVHKKSYSSK